MSRRRRTERDQSRRVAITERDHRVLGLIGQAGVLATDQLARDCFPSLDRARARLRSLYDAGYCERFTFDSRAPDVYALTAAGLRELSDAGLPVDDISLVKRSPSFSGARHARLIGDALLYLDALTRSTEGSELVTWTRGRTELAARAGLVSRGVVPDAVAVVSSPRGRALLAIECDTGHEDVGRVLHAKWTRYASCIARGAEVAELWCVADGGARRLRAVWRGIERHPELAARARLLTSAAVAVRPAQQPARRGAGPDGAPQAPQTGTVPRAQHQHLRGTRAAHPTSETTLETGGDR